MHSNKFVLGVGVSAEYLFTVVDFEFTGINVRVQLQVQERLQLLRDRTIITFDSFIHSNDIHLEDSFRKEYGE